MDESRPKILIVEDEAPILKGIADKFSLSGFTVFQASDGDKGLTIAVQAHPDIILLDFRMPSVDGFSMLKKLRLDDWGKDARVVMWSNSHSIEVIEAARSLNVLDFWVKSDFDFKGVVEKVKILLEIK